MTAATDINDRIARRVRDLRDERGLTLDALAERSGVSRSMISLIERGRSSPTASVLDKLAGGLDVTLSALFESSPRDAAPSPLARRAEQVVWTDPASGYVRRSLSPSMPAPIQLVEVTFPPGRRVAYDSVAHDITIHQQVWMIDGVMELSVGGSTHRLEAGDCLAMQLDGSTVFRNPSRKPAHYLVALATVHSSPRRSA
ncbi:MAG TPA: XRE family transcriptional regulator [Albitalea sp.]|nr:XRE family transcriptional regulator [Albitalea sp.]